jgi:glycerophosphoryl diester phosphodiesterase
MVVTDDGRAVAVIAHRGASAVKRENTVEAFVEARRLGADMVELDVRRTTDGKLVIHHDARIPHVGLVHELRRDALPPWVPTLEQAMHACDGMAVNIEVKNWAADPDFDEDRQIAVAVGDEVRERGWIDRVLVSSFDLATIDRVRAFDGGIATALLTLPGTDQLAATAVAQDRGHRALHPYDLAVSAELVEEVHARGMEINVWTVDDPVRMRALVELGVDGICTNVPDVLVDLLAALGRRFPGSDRA